MTIDSTAFSPMRPPPWYQRSFCHDTELGGVDARCDGGHGAVVAGDAVVDRCGKHPLGVDGRLVVVLGHG